MFHMKEKISMGEDAGQVHKIKGRENFRKDSLEFNIAGQHNKNL